VKKVATGSKVELGLALMVGMTRRWRKSGDDAKPPLPIDTDDVLDTPGGATVGCPLEMFAAAVAAVREATASRKVVRM